MGRILRRLSAAMEKLPKKLKVVTLVQEELKTENRIASFFGYVAMTLIVGAYATLVLPEGVPQGGGGIPITIVSPSALYDLLGSTIHRVRTFMIGYGPADNYTNTLGWENIGENYNPHIGCRGFAGQGGENDPDVRVDDYHRANPDGKMLAYGNTYHEWPATNIPGLVRDEPSLLHAQDPARLRLLPGNGQVRVLWSDDGRGFGGTYAQGQQYLRGESVSIANYRVQRSTSPTGPFTTVGTVAYKQDSPSIHLDTGMEFTSSGLTNGTPYYFKIVSVEGTTELAFSEVQSATPTTSPQPAIAISSVDTREFLDYHNTPSLRDWTYTLTFMVEGSPDEVRLHFDYDKDLQIESPDNGQGQNESIVLAPTEPGKYVFTHTQNPLLDTLPYRAPGFGFFVEAQKGATIVRAPQTDYYSTTINNRAIEKNYGEFVLQRTSTVFRDWYAGQMAFRVSPSDQCDGNFGDVVQLDPQPSIDVVVTGFDRTTWVRQYIDWLAALDQPQYGPFVLNICPSRNDLALTGFTSGKALGEVGDGFLCEGFSVMGGARHWTGWVAGELEGAITVVQQYQQPVFTAPRPRNDLTSDGIKDREYGIAAYNIAREDRTYFYASDELSSPVYEWPGDYPENTLHLGQPLDTSSDGTITAYKMGASYPQNALLRRRFTNGVVAMNTLQPDMGEPDQTIQLGGSYYRVLLRNGILSGKVRDGGYLEISQAPQASVTLSPAEAAVFVTSPTGLPLCAESWVCSAWSACVNNQQSRTCTDEHECGTTVNQPPLTQVCDVTPPGMAGIRTANVGQDRATILWTTDEPATTQVEFGESQSYGIQTPANPTLVTTHEESVGNLRAGTTYHFRARSQDGSQNTAVSADQTFTTASPAAPPPPPSCTEDWSCTDWSACTDGQRARECTDLNRCGTTVNRPALVENCSVPSCTESWSCTDWSACLNGRQTRECTDQSQCGTTALRPERERACGVGGPPTPRPAPTELVTAPAAPGGPDVRRFAADGRLLTRFFAYARTFRGGVNVTSGDVDGDGTQEIITGAGPRGSPHVRVFSATGQLHSQFFGFPRTWRTGGSVTAADLDGDGQDEVVVAPNSGAAHIRVFSFNTAARQYELRTQRFAYPTTFRGGVTLAAGDLDGDGQDEVVVAPYQSGGPQVRVFRYNPATRTLDLAAQFLAYPRSFTTGVSLAVGDVNGDGTQEIVTGAGPGKDPVVRIFTASGRRIVGYLAASRAYRGGVWVGTVQADDDASSEIATSAWSRGNPEVFIVDVAADFRRVTLVRRFPVYASAFKGGVRVSGF